MTGELLNRHGNYGGKQLGPDARFLVEYVQDAGEQALSLREMAAATNKLDDTLLTTVDTLNHRRFVRGVRRQYGPGVPVHSEEGQTVSPGNLELLLVTDPFDGSGEHGATHRDAATGKPFKHGDPIPPDAIPIEDTERTSCVAAALFRNGVMQVAAVYAPYADELFVADRQLGAAYLNGNRLDLSGSPAAQQVFEPGIPYDFASWRGSLLDPRHLRRELGRPPNNTYSAVMQGCDVAAGRSMTGIFTGTTLHDLIPALIVELADGTVTDIHGNPIDWNDPRGAVYSVNSTLHAGVIAAINAPRIDGLPPGYSPVREGEITAEELVGLRNQALFGTERRIHVWQDAIAGSYAFVGAREISTGRLALASFLTGTARHGTMHDLVVHPAHRWQGLASYAINKRVQLAEDYKAGGEKVGMAYLEADLSANELGVIPLGEYYRLLGFVLNKHVLIRDYRHNQVA